MTVDKSNRPIGRGRSRFYRVRKLGNRVEEAQGIMREPMANSILRGARALPPEFEARARQTSERIMLAQAAGIAALAPTSMVDFSPQSPNRRWKLCPHCRVGIASPGGVLLPRKQA